MTGTFRSKDDGSHYPVGASGIDAGVMSDMSRQDTERSKPESDFEKELRLTRARQKKSGLNANNAEAHLIKIATDHTYEWEKFYSREGNMVRFQVKHGYGTEPVWRIFVPTHIDRKLVNRIIRDAKRLGFLYRGIDHYGGSYGQADYKTIEFAFPSIFDRDYPPN